MTTHTLSFPRTAIDVSPAALTALNAYSVDTNREINPTGVGAQRLTHLLKKYESLERQLLSIPHKVDSVVLVRVVLNLDPFASNRHSNNEADAPT